MKEVKTPNIAETVLSATIDDFKLFLKNFEKKHKDLVCSCCGGTHWEINSNPKDKDKPVIVTMPLPLISGSGVWSFYLVCAACGELKFFHANKVATWLIERRKNDHSMP